MKQSILVEILSPENGDEQKAFQLVQDFPVDGFTLDQKYEPVFMSGDASVGSPATVIVRGWVNAESVIEELEKLEDVTKVWQDSIIAPMSSPD